MIVVACSGSAVTGLWFVMYFVCLADRVPRLPINCCYCYANVFPKGELWCFSLLPLHVRGVWEQKQNVSGRVRK